jgi:hypothetical protein
MFRTLISAALLFLLIHPVVAQQKKTPSFEEVISLQSSCSPLISPDRKQIIYEVGKTDWKNNRFDTERWLARVGEEPFQLTNNPNNSRSSPSCSSDGKWDAFLSERSDKTQLHRKSKDLTFPQCQETGRKRCLAGAF